MPCNIMGLIQSRFSEIKLTEAMSQVTLPAGVTVDKEAADQADSINIADHCDLFSLDELYSGLAP